MSKPFDGKVTAARRACLGTSVVLVDLPGLALQTCADTVQATGAAVLAAASPSTARLAAG